MYAFILVLALPSAVLGPVECFHGFQALINSACRARRSGVQPFAMSMLQSFVFLFRPRSWIYIFSKLPALKPLPNTRRQLLGKRLQLLFAVRGAGLSLLLMFDDQVADLPVALRY